MTGRTNLKARLKWTVSLGSLGPPNMFQILLAKGELEKGLCCQRESQKNDHPSPPLALILGHDTCRRYMGRHPEGQ